MKIILVLNNPNREISIMGSIKREILAKNPAADVRIMINFTPNFNHDVLQFKPDVILTFPLTCIGLSTWYYIFKFFFKTKIICYRTEGLVDFNKEEFIQLHVGFDKYGKYLVDYELFWGRKPANVIGSKLFQQKKISTLDRIISVGYPRVESYFSTEKNSQLSKLPLRISEAIKHYNKKNIVMFVTGFQYADYTKEDLFKAKDLDAESRHEELIKGVEITKRFREAWIKNVIKSANDNQEQLFIVKKHPSECREEYTSFENHRNILAIYEDIDIHDILPFVGIFFHYGSTSVIDTYLLQIPSIYVYPEYNENNYYSDLGWPRAKRIPVSKISSVVKEYILGKIKFESIPEIKNVLIDNFNIELDKPYKPSRKIAQIVLDNQPSQKIPMTDPFLWKALCAIFVIRPILRFIRYVLGEKMTIILRRIFKKSEKYYKCLRY